MTNYATGVDAEAHALAHLQAQGFRLITQRYRTSYGEIDLVVERENELRFVEVKARKSMEDALHALTPKQAARIWQCAEAFLAEHPTYQQFNLQIDLIAIAGSQLQHEMNILVAS